MDLKQTGPLHMTQMTKSPVWFLISQRGVACVGRGYGERLFGTILCLNEKRILFLQHGSPCIQPDNVSISLFHVQECWNISKPNSERR